MVGAVSASNVSLSNAKRSWRSTSSPPSTEALTSGYPGCQIHESIIRRTGSPLVASMASQRSLVSVFP